MARCRESAEERPVSPSDCALAVGIPLTAEDLAADIRRPDCEFARVIVAGGRTQDPAGLWSNSYGDVCDSIRSMLHEVRGLGVTVVEAATLDDLSALLRRFPVVSILAHCPFHLLAFEDVQSSQQLLDAFETARCGSAANVHEVIASLLRSDAVRHAGSLPGLLRALNVILEKTRSFFHLPAPAATPSHELPRFFERSDVHGGITPVLLCEAVPAALRWPYVLELRSGMHRFDELVASIPPDYAGTIDFLGCSALSFCEALRRARPQCAGILCPRQLVFSPEWVPIYRATIQQLDWREMPFTTARFRVHSLLISMQQQAGNHADGPAPDTNGVCR